MSADLTTPGRRAAGGGRGRFSLPAVLAVVLPLLTLLVLIPVHGRDTPEMTPQEPASASLGRADVGCPTAIAGSQRVLVATTGDAEGRVQLLDPRDSGSKPKEEALAPGATLDVRSRGPVLVSGTGAMAPGLLATRVGRGKLAALSCPIPQPETWFTGLGAQSTHASTLELVNPDTGPAVVDVDVWGASGPVQSSQVRGVAVPGRGVVRLELAKSVPLRDLLGVRVAVTRGRVAASVEDTLHEVGAAAKRREWVPAQTGPAESAVLPGLVSGATSTLALTNPGEDEARVRVQVVGRGTFAPTAAREVRVPGGTTVGESLDWLRAELRRGDDSVALLVESTQPVVSSLRTEVGDDLSVTAPAAPLESQGAVALPGRDRASLVLAGAESAGQVLVTVRDARGRELASERLRVSAGTGTRVALPRRAAFVLVEVRNTTIQAAVELTGPRGAAVVPLVEPPTEGLVPSVRSVLP